ncbi:MAG: hypothetical protein A2374_00010 [Candidatus Moranbacteria bacterium RIFOXYB1_FULL_44_23]|nr:MAG: hypothetical protein A2407_04995 [Candidatus Moranbacteria bacterium RIFOXYC1_FULL_44_8]OGI40153.1 MAG: hypothetical protein A2374_00010 [Candidatus Moranbacteria bacterium RIFOXYB1_FULL_44_23]HBB36918.1 hypothetical protein [Candidatus Moranbacteria bacterium]HBU25204.1 hypothetical protein [Candidatus Moranbacteria bacterium]
MSRKYFDNLLWYLLYFSSEFSKYFVFLYTSQYFFLIINYDRNLKNIGFIIFHIFWISDIKTRLNGRNL